MNWADTCEQGITVIYGGGKIGLMGAVAEGVLQNGGKSIGVIPDFLQTKEVAHEDVSRTDSCREHARAQSEDA